MSMELIAIISVGITIIGVSVGLATLILNGQGIQRKEIQAVREEMQSQRTETQAEFKAVREEFKAVREEMQAEFKDVREEIKNVQVGIAHLQGLFEGLREAITGRRVVAEAVAEAPGQYEQR